MTIETTINITTHREIRHAGRCHVRGQIRRVWRPRYLELCDHGLVRYYELPDNDNNNNNNNRNSKNNNSQAEQFQPSSSSTSSSSSSLNRSTMIPKCTLQVLQVRIIDVTTLRDMHVGLPRGTFGFCLSGIRQLVMESDCKPEPSHLERDFLCAVGTLEEAQSWVVALQWAASVSLARSWDSDDDLYHAASAATATLNSLGQHSHGHGRLAKQNALQIVTSPTVSIGTTADSKTLSVSKTSKLAPKQKQGKIVVTKVLSLRIIRHTTGVNLAYQISLLLLRPGSSTEERQIVRTRQDIYTLLMDLREESTHSKSQQVLNDAHDRLSQAPTNYKEFIATLPIMESVMRSLAMDGGICNSVALRRFWALDKSVLQRPLIDIHISNNVISQQQQLNETGDTETFVKQWLSQGKVEQYSWRKAVTIWCLQHPIYVGGGFFIPLVVTRPIVFIREHFIPSLLIKADVLLFSWFAASYLGREYEKWKPRKIQNLRRRPSMEDDVHSLDEEQASVTDEEILIEEEHEEKATLSSPLPPYPANGGTSCWSKPNDNLFRVRSATYLQDRVKAPSGPAPFRCRGVDVWITDNPERNIARHPSVMGGKLEDEDTFLVNFLLPFGNFVAYFGIPKLDQFPPKLQRVWTKFVQGDQQYRDARLKLLPLVVEGPWIVKAAVGPGTAPALLGKVIPLQYYFRSPTDHRKGIYEVDIIITASRIAKGILSVVKGHTKALSIAFAFIIEASEEDDLPETVLCSFQLHSLHLEDCPQLPECNLDEVALE